MFHNLEQLKTKNIKQKLKKKEFDLALKNYYLLLLWPT
jgi:hypothetical protein